MVNSQLLNTVTVISLAFCLSCVLQSLEKHAALKIATITNLYEVIGVHCYSCSDEYLLMYSCLHICVLLPAYMFFTQQNPCVI